MTLKQKECAGGIARKDAQIKLSIEYDSVLVAWDKRASSAKEYSTATQSLKFDEKKGTLS